MAQPSLDSFVGTTNQPQAGLDSFAGGGVSAQTQPAPQKSLSDSIWDGIAGVGNAVNSVLPGKQIGESLVKAGTNIANLATGGISKFNAGLPENTVNVPQLAGDYLSAGATIASPELGGGTGGGLAGSAGRIGTNAALGAGISGASALASGKDAGGIATATGEGGLVGGALSAGAEGVGAITKNLPNWFTKAALPKLDDKNIPYALENTKILGSAPSLLKNSNSAIKSYEGQIQSILAHPEFRDVAGDTGTIVNTALGQFPNSQYTATSLFNNAKKIAPDVSGLIQKVEAGQANLQELNTVRKSLDSATKSVYTSLNRPPEAKALGAALAGAIRDYVQSEAPATQPIFADYSKEIGLNKALVAAVKRNQMKISLKDIVAGVGGFGAGGVKGAIGAIALERLGGSTGVDLAAAKGAQALGKAAPVAGALLQGAKAPIESAIGQQ